MRFEEYDHKGQKIDYTSLDYQWLRRASGKGRNHFCPDNYQKWECTNERYLEKSFVLKMDNYLKERYPDMLDWEFDVLKGKCTGRNKSCYAKGVNHNINVVRGDGRKESIIVNNFAINDSFKAALFKMADNFVDTRESKEKAAFLRDLDKMMPLLKETGRGIMKLSSRCKSKDVDKYIAWCREIPGVFATKVCSEDEIPETKQFWQINLAYGKNPMADDVVLTAEAEEEPF